MYEEIYGRSLFDGYLVKSVFCTTATLTFRHFVSRWKGVPEVWEGGERELCVCADGSCHTI